MDVVATMPDKVPLDFYAGAAAAFVVIVFAKFATRTHSSKHLKPGRWAWVVDSGGHALCIWCAWVGLVLSLAMLGKALPAWELWFRWAVGVLAVVAGAILSLDTGLQRERPAEDAKAPGQQPGHTAGAAQETENRLVRTKDSVGNLWRFYEEHASQARQHENLRATVTSILCSIAAAVVALAGLGGLNRTDIPAGIVVVLLSFLGVGLGIKHYERNRFHTSIMGAVRDEITRLDQDPHANPESTQTIRRAGVRKHNKEFTVLERKDTRKTDSRSADRETAEPNQQQKYKSVWPRIPLHLLWLGLPLAIGTVGVLVLVLSFVGVVVK
jgi:cytochrome c biogenesis protein CcdA